MFSDDIKEYQSYLDAFHAQEIYNQSGYCLSEANRLEGKFVFYKDNHAKNDLIIPFIEREYKLNGEVYKDLTMSYGYPTPFSKNKTNEIDVDGDRFIESCSSKGYLSAFIRYDPLVSFKVKRLPIEIVGKTVSLNLELNEEERRCTYRKVHRREIKKCAALGMHCEFSEMVKTDIDFFKEIYERTMDRIGADRSYYFPKETYENMLDIHNSKIYIGKAYMDNELVACSLFIVSGGRMQYYLSGSELHKYRGFGSKMLIDEAANMGHKMNLTKLNLGGGVGGKTDSLFDFKMGFGSVSDDVIVSKVVIDKDLYKSITASDGTEGRFPAYRN